MNKILAGLRPTEVCRRDLFTKKFNGTEHLALCRNKTFWAETAPHACYGNALV